MTTKIITTSLNTEHTKLALIKFEYYWFLDGECQARKSQSKELALAVADASLAATAQVSGCHRPASCREGDKPSRPLLICSASQQIGCIWPAIVASYWVRGTGGGSNQLLLDERETGEEPSFQRASRGRGRIEREPPRPFPDPWSRGRRRGEAAYPTAARGCRRGGGGVWPPPCPSRERERGAAQDAFLVGEWGTTRERRIPRGPANLEEPPGSAYRGNIPLQGISAFRSLFQLNTGIAPRCRSDPLHSTSFPVPNTP